MTKAIKFNLLLDKHPVRDLEDLRANFNLDDLLTAYHSQVLHRWLEVRGLTAELEQLNAIKSTDELSIASALCELFQENLSEADIKTAVYPFEFRKQQQQRLEGLASQQFNKDAVIEGYHAGYKKLCAKMLEKAGDYPFLKAAVNTLWTDYAQLFSVDFNRFFDEFFEKSPLTLFTMLANNNYRKAGVFEDYTKERISVRIPCLYETNYYLGDTDQNFEELTDQEVFIKDIFDFSHCVKVVDNDSVEYDSDEAYYEILNGLQFCSNDYRDYIEYAILPFERKQLPAPYKSYAGITDGYWKDLEPKGKKCLILKMEDDCLIRNIGKNGEELNAYAINEEFLILDGIDYKSNNADHALIYMVI